jgi:hypothetical protein
MFRLRLAPRDWSIGGPVKLADGRAGRLTELAPTDGHFEALAVLNSEVGAAGDHAPGDAAPLDGEAAPGERADAVELPLPYSALPGTA